MTVLAEATLGQEVIEMYKTTVRALVRRGLRNLNDGDPALLLRLAHPEAELAFPGDNSIAAMYRPVVKDRDAHMTHRGLDELAGFTERIIEIGLHFHVDDILVNGGAVADSGGGAGPNADPRTIRQAR